MIDYTHTTIEKLIIHHIAKEEGNSIISDKEIKEINETDFSILNDIFLKPFTKNAITYEFTHEIDLDMNVLSRISNTISKADDFVKSSQNIFKHLKAVSKHPNIKDGDLIVVQYDKLIIKDAQYKAYGIYKIETKNKYIETQAINNNQIGIHFKEGIGSGKLDKASLIVFTDDKPTVFIIDNVAVETEYWKNDFLKISYKNDYVNHTNSVLSMTKSFIKEQVAEEFEISKTDQIDLLNRSIDYFKNNESYKEEEFEEIVLHDSNVINSYRAYKETTFQGSDLAPTDEFEIAQQVVKKQASSFKSVLKLDRNFHIYIHGDRNLISQGVDENGDKYYKIYYQEVK